MARLGDPVTSSRRRPPASPARAEPALRAAVDGRLVAVIAVADPIKETTTAALEALREQREASRWR